MAKLRTILDIRIQHESGNYLISKDSYINVSEELAVFLCDEDLIINEIIGCRTKKAVRTGFFSLDNLSKPHEDYTFL